MASLGYVVACVDGRGTGGRGSEFQKCTYLNLGVKEAKDQVEAAKYLGGLPYGQRTYWYLGMEFRRIYDHHEYERRYTRV